MTLSPVGLLDSGEYPEGIDTTSNGKEVVVANWFDNTLTIYDAKSLSMVQQLDVCDGPRAFGKFILRNER